MNIQELLPLFKEYGIGGVVAFVILYILYIIFRNKVIIDHSVVFITNLFKSEKNTVKTEFGRKITNSDITNHDIFSFIDLWTYSKIPTLLFPNEFRTIVFRKYLTLYLNKHKSQIYDYVISGNYKAMDDSMLWQSILKLINDIIQDYEREMMLNGIPIIVIEKMKARNNESIALMVDLIEGICTSNFYDTPDNLLKVYSILNIVLSILQNTIYGSEKTCASINGQLKGQTYIKDGIVYQEP
jgi:hypothetical protein